MPLQAEGLQVVPLSLLDSEQNSNSGVLPRTCQVGRAGDPGSLLHSGSDVLLLNSISGSNCLVQVLK